MKTLFSTGEAARICGISRSTFKRWFRQHQPVMRRTPGGDIRISRAELAAFAEACGLPVELFEDAPSSLVAVQDHTLENALVTALRRNIPSGKIAIARDETAFGFELAQIEPRLVFIEPMETPMLTAAYCRRIRGFLPGKVLHIGLVAEADDSMALPGGPDMAMGDDSRRAALDQFVLRLWQDGGREAG